MKSGLNKKIPDTLTNTNAGVSKHRFFMTASMMVMSKILNEVILSLL